MMINDNIIEKATKFLIKQDQDLSLIISQEGKCRLKVEKREPFEALLKAIAGQQLHAKAVLAILQRLESLHPSSHSLPSPQELLAYSENQLRRCGFSFRKINSLYALAKATIDQQVPNYEKAQTMSDQDLIDLLTKLPGIGRWTVEMLLIFTLGRLDIMPVDDFGVREGWKLCKKLPTQPKPTELRKLTEVWSPYRSVGTWYLWRAVDQLKPKEKQNPMTL